MDNKKLAELLFPNAISIEEIEKRYPKRDLPKEAQVTRFAPSPTGYMHLGGFFSALIDYNIAKRSGGVFYLRIEDTDKKREISGASAVIMGILGEYDFMWLMQKNSSLKERLSLVFAKRLTELKA